MRTAKIGLYILLFLGIGLSAQGYQLPELIPFRLGDTWGYCDQDGALRIPANYDAAMPFRAGTAVIFRKDRAGLIDQDGNVLLPFVYDEIFNDAYLRIRKNTHFALANKEGKLLTEFVFDQIFPEKSGLFRIENNGLMGMIDTAGKAIIPPLYQHISILRDAKGNYTDLIQVHLDGKYGIYDRCGTALSKPIYASIGVFWDGFAIVKREGRFGMIDLEGQEVVLAVYENLHPLREGLSAALVRGRWGFVDTEGQEAIPFRYTEVNGEGFYQGRAAVFFRDEWTFIDRQGRAKISVKGPYSCLGSLSEGLASACILSKSGHPFYGYLNQNGRLVIPCEFARAYPFRDGFALTGQYVTSQESHSPKLRFGVIDRKGRE
ncbi:MAG TPA: WG repeat-containing protein, partial [Bacteroidetes bacterium]|nr:WG repeat-containing protein [Bacteroidota bacterium]